jgi:hypothetical protein
VSSTEDLAKATLTLQRATGLDARTASAWAEILKVRGIDTRKFGTGLVKLSKQMTAASSGNVKAANGFRNLGVAMDDVSAGDVNAVLMQTADAFSRMTNPAEKAATAQALFGKSGQALVPILTGGSKGISEQMALVNKYGATLGSTEGAKQMIAQQRELRFAMDGLKIQLGTRLMPAVEAFVGLLLKVVQAVAPVLRNTTALNVVMGLLFTAYVALKVQASASAVALIWNNAALLGIVLAALAIVAGIVVLYAKWKWFHDLVNGTLAWVKDHWQLLAAILLGPLAGAVILLARNFGKVKAGVSSAFTTITNVAGAMGRFLSGAFNFDPSVIARGVADWLNNRTWFGDAVKFAGFKLRLPALASGGTMRVGGPAIVGEEGPEVVTTASYPVPDVVKVKNPKPPAILAQRYGVGRPHVPLVQEVHLTRRQLADAAGDHVSDAQARR